MNKEDITQQDIVKEFFLKHPNEDIKHPVVVEEEWIIYIRKLGKHHHLIYVNL